MIEYRPARADEESEILDFSNMVFGMSSGPIDFSKLYPAIYGRPGFSKLHIIAKDERDRLVASIAVKPLRLKLGHGESLSAGYLGTVATHPRERGKGYMKQLMRLHLERARERGMDLVALGGQRQRYNHYGFENGAPLITFSLNGANLRTVQEGAEYSFLPFRQADERMIDAAYERYLDLEMTAERNREDFGSLLLTGGGSPYIVLEAGLVRGYVCAAESHIYEYACDSETDPLCLARCWLEAKGRGEFDFSLPMHAKESIRTLGEVAESWKLHDGMMVNVLNWPSVLEKLMNHKARHEALRDGEALVGIEGCGTLRLSVKDNRATVSIEGGEAPQVRLTQLEAVRTFLSPFGRLQGQEDPYFGWFPLMLSIARPDWF